MSDDGIMIVFPAVDDDVISQALRVLTQRLVEAGHDASGGMLGGEYGYGAWYENDVFMMHPFCWCEQPDCEWCNECLCTDDAAIYFVNDEPATFDEWWNETGARVDPSPSPRGSAPAAERAARRLRTSCSSRPGRPCIGTSTSAGAWKLTGISPRTSSSGAWTASRWRHEPRRSDASAPVVPVAH